MAGSLPSFCAVAILRHCLELRKTASMKWRRRQLIGEIAWDGGLAIRLGRDHGDVAAIAGLRAGPIVVKSFVANRRGVYPRPPYIAVRRAAGPSEGQQPMELYCGAVNDIYGKDSDIYGKDSRFPGESKKARRRRYSCPTMKALARGRYTVTPKRWSFRPQSGEKSYSMAASYRSATYSQFTRLSTKALR